MGFMGFVLEQKENREYLPKLIKVSVFELLTFSFLVAGDRVLLTRKPAPFSHYV